MAPFSIIRLLALMVVLASSEWECVSSFVLTAPKTYTSTSGNTDKRWRTKNGQALHQRQVLRQPLFMSSSNSISSSGGNSVDQMRADRLGDIVLLKTKKAALELERRELQGLSIRKRQQLADDIAAFEDDLITKTKALKVFDDEVTKQRRALGTDAGVDIEIDITDVPALAAPVSKPKPKPGDPTPFLGAAASLSILATAAAVRASLADRQGAQLDNSTVIKSKEKMVAEEAAEKAKNSLVGVSELYCIVLYCVYTLYCMMYMI
jgi:hypothetical protein